MLFHLVSFAELALIGQLDKEIDVSPDDMIFLRDMLCTAEAARRKGLQCAVLI